MEVVSRDSSGVLGNGPSQEASVSADGRFIAFASQANNLVSGDTNQVWDVFLRDRYAETTTRISVSTNGIQGDYPSRNPRISRDGHFIVFESSATNFSLGDTNQHADIYSRDLLSGVTARVSSTSFGAEGDGPSSSPRLSQDSRYIVFESAATNFSLEDTNAKVDIYGSPDISVGCCRASLGSNPYLSPCRSHFRLLTFL